MDSETCLSCHGGSWEALAKLTSDLGDYNPHDSIHGTIENCNECHKGHSNQVDVCQRMPRQRRPDHEGHAGIAGRGPARAPRASHGAGPARPSPGQDRRPGKTEGAMAAPSAHHAIRGYLEVAPARRFPGGVGGLTMPLQSCHVASRRKGGVVGRRPGVVPSLSQEKITEEALLMMDEEGVGAFTIRGLAGRLGVSPMGIYTYFKSKDEIVASVQTRMRQEYDNAPIPGERWDDSLRRTTPASFRESRPCARERVHPAAGMDARSCSSTRGASSTCTRTKACPLRCTGPCGRWWRRS